MQDSIQGYCSIQVRCVQKASTQNCKDIYIVKNKQTMECDWNVHVLGFITITIYLALNAHFYEPTYIAHFQATSMV